MQMYKVFVNDCPIILTDDNKISTNLRIVNFDVQNVKEIIEQLFSAEINGICLICNDLEYCWSFFKSLFKLELAAGGKVYNTKKEILFIYRFNKWDLPKGALEKNESIEQCAVREVEEECGVSNLNIENTLETTYHVFYRNNKLILKITYWYLMSTNFDGHLVPQLEEGIEKVVFKNEVSTKKALTNTYENIKLLF